ncbi:host-nuclease inhibitor Gam family protein [Apilactobacillus quenuiae]|uniref:host-nuclease inhibitor Gam family protein n=1 Tax=Apilactobacillus quenuiae TaxID=2008377 RepID=UPI000D01D8A7|nr:host-nuclease inhibitor Gam family protein [Apilactobacillus quenuiae]
MSESEFIIQDDMTANWAFSKLAEDKQKLIDLDKQKQAYMDQVNSWYERKANKIIDQRDYMQSKLNDYRITKPGGKIDVPFGRTIVKNLHKPKYNDDKLLNYVRMNQPKMIKTEYKFSKNELKKHYQIVDGKAIDDNGQIIDGIKFEQTESVSFKLNKGTE